MPEITPNEIEAEIKEQAKKFADEYINDPSAAQYALVEKAITFGWQLGVKQAIGYMRDHGVVIGEK